MPEEKEQSNSVLPTQKKKACQINLMFPVEDDMTAFGIKQSIDNVVKDIEGKRYTFNIVEL